MKTTIPVIIIMLFLISFISCEEDECKCQINIYKSWEASDFMSIESVLYTKENGYNPVIEFKTDGTLAFQLDANGGTGTFEISENNSIEIANLGWTDMCCDSEFSEKFVEMLLLVNSFSIEGNILKLFVTEWGWIELKLISD